ncbi:MULTISPECIES: hypothetical protein [unclassified Rathayibacter]|uniref:hypothetical protein n=1 Tax=unclassified Rathayibacter TaxID=2609250 RepID=UPI0006F96184|nr:MULTISPECIES: hypothetical protein [unclassified Rathayibacter]KQQ06007.1 hypothetical protein ASF42_05590 [Rathayibacter sp. Leaf294]KQS13864.1 hypothetical protein ASG06_05600 [Rathayibacter sp. Leaf185]
MRVIAPSERSSFVRGGERGDLSAAAWLSDVGLQGRPSAPLRIVADVLRHDGLEVLRIWHTPGRFSRRPDAGEGIRMLIPLDGTLAVLPDDPAEAEVRVGVGGVAFLRRETAFTVVTEARTARIEIELARPLIAAPENAGALDAPADAAARRILVAMTNAVFGARPDPECASFPLLGAALEQLAGALLLTSLPREEGGDAYTAALALISAMSADPALSVHELSTRLEVPKRTLQRMFARHGTTVFGEIRRARLARAQALLAGDDAPADHALADYAGSRRLQRDASYAAGALRG